MKLKYENVNVEIFSVRAKDGATFPATGMIHEATKSGVANTQPCSMRLTKIRKKGTVIKAKRVELEPYVAKHGKLKGKTLYTVRYLEEA